MTDFIINPPKARIDGTVDTIFHVILDGSTSMFKIRAATRSGLNEYLQGIPKSTENSRTLVSITKFADNGSLELIPIRSYADINLVAEIGENEYVPRGYTPLLDAIGAVVRETDAVAQTSPTPPAVMIIIVTDGEENYSRTETNESIRKLIADKQENDKWTFVYLGANQDSFAEAAKYGIAAGNTANYDVGAVAEAFHVVGAASASYSMSNSLMRSVDKSAKFSTSDSYAESGTDNSKVIDKK